MPPALTDQTPIRERPTAWMLHLCMVLVGLATALLGPILPLLGRHWQLQDQQSGLLLLAQFCGSFTGGMTISKHLRRSLILGLAAGAIGFAAFALAPGLPIACIALFAAGWGSGQIITSGNIIAGRRYGSRRGSALALLNFSFSVGAMLSPLLAAWLTPRIALRTLIEAFAACFAIVLIILSIEFNGQPSETLPASDTSANSHNRLAATAFVYFAILLFLYGGIETSLNGWLTTFSLRYGSQTLALSEYTTLIFWASLGIGHALTSLVLLRIKERPLQRAGLAATSIFIAALAVAHGGTSITSITVLLGLSLAPVFPTTFSLLMADRPSARQAGIVLSLSGLGAASIPAIMGVVSTHWGSLQRALFVPLAVALTFLALSLLHIGTRQTAT